MEQSRCHFATLRDQNRDDRRIDHARFSGCCGIPPDGGRHPRQVWLTKVMTVPVPPLGYAMPDITLADMALILRRAQRWIIGATVTGIVLAASIAFSVPDQYKAEGLLLTGGPVGNSAEIEGIHVTRDAFSAPALKHIAESDQILGKVAADLLSSNFVPLEATPWPSAVMAVIREWVARAVASLGGPSGHVAAANPVASLRMRLSKNLVTTAELDSGAVILSYTDSSPEWAAVIANRIMTAVVTDRQLVMDRERSTIVASLREQLGRMRAEMDERTREIAELRQQLEFDSTSGGTVLDRRITEAARALTTASADLAAARARFNGAKQAVTEDAVSNRDSGMVLSPLLDKLRQDQARVSQSLAGRVRKSVRGTRN